MPAHTRRDKSGVNILAGQQVAEIGNADAILVIVIGIDDIDSVVAVGFAAIGDRHHLHLFEGHEALDDAFGAVAEADHAKDDPVIGRDSAAASQDRRRDDQRSQGSCENSL